jgi:hypothetical protein
MTDTTTPTREQLIAAVLGTQRSLLINSTNDGWEHPECKRACTDALAALNEHMGAMERRAETAEADRQTAERLLRVITAERDAAIAEREIRSRRHD